jgi:hypothetical protein
LTKNHKYIKVDNKISFLNYCAVMNVYVQPQRILVYFRSDESQILVSLCSGLRGFFNRYKIQQVPFSHHRRKKGRTIKHRSEENERIAAESLRVKRTDDDLTRGPLVPFFLHCRSATIIYLASYSAWSLPSLPRPARARSEPTPQGEAGANRDTEGT